MIGRWSRPSNIIIASLVAAAAVVGHGGAWSLAADEPLRLVAQADPTEMTRVRFAVLVAPLMVNAAIMIARERALFAKNGLDVEFVSVDATPAGLAALSAGAVQFSFTGPNIIDAVAAGLPLVAVFALANSPSLQICAIESIRTVKDLVGKTIGVPNRGSSPDVALRIWLKEQGIGDSQVTIRNFAAGELALRAAIASRAVDAYSSGPPNCRQVTPGTDHLLADVAASGMKLFNSGVAVTRDYLASNRPAVGKFVASLVEAAKLFRENREVASRVITDVEKLADPKGIQEVWDFWKRIMPYPPMVSEEAMQNAIKFSLIEKTREIGPSLVSKIYDNSAVEEIVGK